MMVDAEKVIDMLTEQIANLYRDNAILRSRIWRLENELESSDETKVPKEGSRIQHPQAPRKETS